MSTRGFISFVADGQTKTAYNHFDSYPSGLGNDVLLWLCGADLAAAKALARELRVVDNDTEVTDADVERFKGSYDPSVGGPSARPTWYQLLSGTRGDPAAILAAGVLLDASNFPADSLFAEWGYVVDFDTEAFEAYAGFQRSRHADGRFADMAPLRDSEYFPVRLVKSWPFDALPSTDELVGIDA